MPMPVVAPLDSEWAGPGERKGCGNCKHSHLHTIGATCDAFPAGVPGLFVNGYELHDKPFPGDNGIMYEGLPRRTLEELFAELDEKDRREGRA